MKLSDIDQAVNDSGLTAKQVVKRLDGENGVRITWGETSVIVERQTVDHARAQWSAARELFTPQELARERDSIIADIEAAISETNKKRPQKHIMDKLMADLVAWHALALDA